MVLVKRCRTVGRLSWELSVLLTIAMGMFGTFTFRNKHFINFRKLFICRESLIRIAFQCLQLVVTDFLPVMPWRCLPLCVNTAAKFGSQTQELNISLTAVGLMVRKI